MHARKNYRYVSEINKRYLDYLYIHNKQYELLGKWHINRIYYFNIEHTNKPSVHEIFDIWRLKCVVTKPFMNYNDRQKIMNNKQISLLFYYVLVLIIIIFPIELY